MYTINIIALLHNAMSSLHNAIPCYACYLHDYHAGVAASIVHHVPPPPPPLLC